MARLINVVSVQKNEMERSCYFVTMPKIKNDVISIDGKTVRRSKDIRITSTRIIRDKTSVENRLYISSLNSNAKDFNRYIRQHWGVENSLHYTLDMTFNEDQQRKRDKNAAQNFSIIQKIALNLLKKEKSMNISIKAKRLKAAWDNDFLIRVLGS